MRRFARVLAAAVALAAGLALAGCEAVPESDSEPALTVDGVTVLTVADVE
jgi:hypothetical protein